jgi:hypothetical protein
MVVCSIDSRTDQGASWGPGLALIWPGGKALRVNVRADGRFGVDDGKNQWLEGQAEQGKPCRLAIRLAEKEVLVYASQQPGFTQELARLPRADFPGQPTSLRIGKMSPAADSEDFSEAGPEGVCAITQLRVFGATQQENR